MPSSFESRHTQRYDFSSFLVLLAPLPPGSVRNMKTGPSQQLLTRAYACAAASFFRPVKTRGASGRYSFSSV
jgi:hypothetical protein